MLPVIQLPEGVTSVGSSAFADCTTLNSIYIPSETENIASDACEGCTNELLICGTAGSKAEAFANANGFAFSSTSSAEWLGARLPDEYFEVIHTYSINGATYHEIKLIKAYNGVQPQDGNLYLDHRYRVVRNPYTLVKLFTMSKYFDSPVSELLNVYAPRGMEWEKVTLDFIHDDQVISMLGSAGGIVLKLALGDPSLVMDYIGLADKDFFKSMGTIAYINASVNHLNKAVDTAAAFAEKVEANPTYDDVLLSLEHLQYCATCYDAAQGVCMPIIDDILAKYQADYQLGFRRLKDALINFVGSTDSYMKALLTGIDELATGNPDGVKIFTSFLEYLGDPFEIAFMTINVQSGIFEGIQQWTSAETTKHDELLAGYFITIEQMRLSETYARQQLLGQ